MASTIEGLPACRICHGNGRDVIATRVMPVKLGRWYLCERHAGPTSAEVPWASVARARGARRAKAR